VKPPNETSGQKKHVTLFHRSRRAQILRTRRCEGIGRYGGEKCLQHNQSPRYETVASWPADQPERWPIERLIPYATNPRLHTRPTSTKLLPPSSEFGWTMPPLVDEKGMLIAGAARVAAAAKLKAGVYPGDRSERLE